MFGNHGSGCLCRECHSTRDLNKRELSDAERECTLAAMKHEGKASDHYTVAYGRNEGMPQVSDEQKLAHMEAASLHSDAADNYRRAVWSLRDGLPKGAEELKSKAASMGAKADKKSKELGMM